MKTWITADWHLGEDRFELMQRPFETADQMISTLMYNHNKLVHPDDRVIVVGDVCYQKTPEYLKQVKFFNGHKTLVRGNHDRVFSNDDLVNIGYFEEIYPEGEGFEIKVANIDCYVTHYPTGARADKFNLVGHIHSAWKIQLNMVNVGVDVNHFKPLQLETYVPFIYKAINEFYDLDVWIAYDKANADYKDVRGKKTRYFTNEN